MELILDTGVPKASGVPEPQNLYNYFSQQLNLSVHQEIRTNSLKLIQQLLKLPEVARLFTSEELVSQITYPDIQIIPALEDQLLCHARIMTGQRCTRRAKFEHLCGAHHKMSRIDLINHAPTSLEDERKHSSEPSETSDTGSVSDDLYIPVDHVEIEHRSCLMENQNGLLFQDIAPYTIIGQVNSQENTLTWFS